MKVRSVRDGLNALEQARAAQAVRLDPRRLEEMRDHEAIAAAASAVEEERERREKASPTNRHHRPPERPPVGKGSRRQKR